MKVNVKLFARARDLAGASCVEVELSQPATVSSLRKELIAQYPKLTPLVLNLLVAVGTEYASEETVLQSDSDVACFPPVSGG